MSAFASQGCSRISSIPNPFDLDISPVVGACSGHGSCVNETCVCTSGWTGRSDLIDTEGLACQVNENVLRGMWGVAAVVAIICFGLSYSKIKQRATDYFATKRRKEAMGKRYTLRNNRGVMASLFHTTLVYPSVLLYALLKEANADERLGLTFGTTLCFFVMKTGFYLAMWAFQGVAGNRATDRIVHVNFIVTRVSSIVGIVSSFAPFATLAFSDGTDTLAQVVYFVVIGGSFMQAIVLGLQAFLTKYYVVRALDASMAVSPSQHTADIKRALIDLESQGVQQGSIQFVVLGSFVLLPYLVNKTDYLVPCQAMVFCMLGVKLSNLTIMSKSGSSSAVATASKDSDSNYSSNVAVASHSYVTSAVAPSNPEVTFDFDDVHAPKSPNPAAPHV